MDQAEKAEKFSNLHKDGTFILPNAWDVASACVLVDVGYEAIATTSGGCAFSMGFCDGENIGREGMAEVVGRIARNVNIPVSADMEAGYGPLPEDVAKTIKAALDAGVVGVNIEDSIKIGPRRLYDFEIAVERIRSARISADKYGIPAVINARTDGYTLGGDEDMFDETVRRANAYLEAGANCAFVIGVRDGALIQRLVSSVDGAVNILAGPGTPPISELKRIGVRRVTVGGNLAKAAYSLVMKAAKEMKFDGTYNFAAGIYSQAEMHRMIKGE